MSNCEQLHGAAVVVVVVGAAVVVVGALVVVGPLVVVGGGSVGHSWLQPGMVAPVESVPGELQEVTRMFPIGLPLQSRIT